MGNDAGRFLGDTITEMALCISDPVRANLAGGSGV
jgi:hypothetical protein